MGETGEVPVNTAGTSLRQVAAQQPETVTTEASAQIDPRVYFAAGQFQIKAESIDSDMGHPWRTVHDRGFLAENNFGTIVVGVTYDTNKAQTTEETPFGLLIAEKTSGGQSSSVFIEGLSEKQRGNITDAVNQFVPSLPDEMRHQFIRKIIQEAPNLKDENAIAQKLAKMGLELLPDYANSTSVEQFSQWAEVGGKTPTEEQRAQLAEFTRLVASKMPSDKFFELMKKYQDDLKYTHDPYGTTYQTIFTDMAQWVLDEREDTQRNYPLLKRIRPDQYTVKDKVTQPINSVAELETALAALPVEPMPDTRGKYHANEIPEMVRLESVMGGTGIKTWSVSTSEGRGLPHIFTLTNKFQSDELNIAGNGRDEPIKLIEVGGKFYVSSDGRHRVAALKALGVAEVPAMVIHIT